MSRVLALLGKELADLRQNLAIFVPSVIVTVVAIFMPVMVAVIVPAVTGERLSDSGDLEIALEMYKKDPTMRALEPEAAIQAYVFQYFLVMENNAAKGFPAAALFFNVVLSHTIQGTFCDPFYGGNANFVGWDLLGYPGIRLTASANDQRMDVSPAPTHMSAYDFSMFARKKPNAR